MTQADRSENTSLSRLRMYEQTGHTEVRTLRSLH